MPVLSAKHKVLFLLAPGTGSSAVSKGVLLPSLDGTYVPAESIRDEAGNVVVSHWHATVSDLRRFGLLSDEELKDLLKFTSVRNPFDVLVTEYIRLRAQWTNGFSDRDARHVSPRRAERVQLALECETFGEWVERRFLAQGTRRRIRHPLVRYVKPRHRYAGFLKDADFIMKFERLQEDFDEVTRRLGFAERFEIPKPNVTTNRDPDYRAYYTPKAKKIVQTVFAPDLDRFGYEF